MSDRYSVIDYTLPADQAFRMPRMSYNPGALTPETRWMSVEVGGKARFGRTMADVCDAVRRPEPSR